VSCAGLRPALLIDPVAFRTFAPHAIQGTLEAIEAAAGKHGLSHLPLAHWLAQMHVESAGFTRLVESLNYSVEGLRATFGPHRISDADCQRYGRKPGQIANQEAIANIVYGGEWGRVNLGNTEPGDGWRFRGSGCIQQTGRRNIEATGYTPEELRSDIAKAVDSAAVFFISHGCVPLAQADDVRAVTRKINGGENGLAERMKRTLEAKGLLL
jgi:putative chitinase